MSAPETPPHMSSFDARVVSAVAGLLVVCVGALGATLWYDHHSGEKAPPLEAIVSGYTQEMHQTLSTLTQRLDGLEHALQDLQKAPPVQPVTEAMLSEDLSPLTAALLSLQQQMALQEVLWGALSGAPFDGALARAMDLFQGEEEISNLFAPLLPISENGAPTPLMLIEWFHFSLYQAPHAPLADTPPADPNASWWSRAWNATRGAFTGLIRIRRVEETRDGLPPPASDALHLAITRALSEDRLQDALDMAARLPDPEQRLLTRWGRSVHERLNLLGLLAPLRRACTPPAR